MTSTTPQILRSRVALRERALLDVFDLAMRFCAVHALPYAKLSLVVLLPAFAASYAASRAGGWWVGWIVTVALTAFAEAPFVVLGSKLVFASEVRTWEVIRLVLRALPSLLAVLATRALALVTSALLCGLPWFVVSTVLLFVVEVLLLEQYRGVGATFGRAQRIAGSRFGTAFSTMLLLAAAPAATAMVADVAGREILSRLLEIRPPASLFQKGGSWLALAGWWATVPMISTARFFVYLDIRTRSEGWDIQTRFASIAARALARAERGGRTHGGAALLVLASLCVPCLARAEVNPARSRAGVDEAIAENGYAFCREPREPLTLRARELCVHAREIPRCEGFAAACARADPLPRERPTERPEAEPAPIVLKVSALVGVLARMAVWILVAAVLAAVVVPILRAVGRLRSRRGPTADDVTGEAKTAPSAIVPAPEGDEHALLARADDLARHGNGAAALELYLAASLRALGKRGAIRLSQDRTNGEYLRQCTDSSAKPALSTMVRDVDRVKFGGEIPSADALSRAGRDAASLVRATALLVLLAIVPTFGCGGDRGARSRRPADDPAGDELWFELLRRQGTKAARLETALASLPLPEAGQRSPAVVVDARRTELDPETLDHLTAWVDAGGVLVLLGASAVWHGEFVRRTSGSDHHRVTARRLPGRPNEVSGADEPEEEDAPVLDEQLEHAELASGAGFDDATKGCAVAWFDDKTPYASVVPQGKGYVLGIATDELMTNVGLARDGNAGAMLAIFSNAQRSELRVAEEDDGVAPPSSPVVSLSRAGLGTALVHGLVASLLLFFAVGVRLTRPRPSPPPPSRPFAEHVEAVGALYARAHVTVHARDVYARFERRGAPRTEEGRAKWTRQRFSTRSRE
jgi:hypothetical protein